MEFKHDANMKASLGHTRTRDVTLMPDSEALNPVSGRILSQDSGVGGKKWGTQVEDDLLAPK